jgi:hypothetical protein
MEDGGVGTGNGTDISNSNEKHIAFRVRKTASELTKECY